jgi:HK97 family phage major capsid protein
MGIINLKQERAERVREVRKTIGTAEVRGDGLTADEQRAIDTANERIDEINGELAEIESKRGGKPMTGAAARGMNSRDDSGTVYRTAPDAGDPGRSWFADVLAASKGDAEARDALSAFTRYTDDMERRTGLLVGTSTAGSEFAAPVLTDMGSGANIPRVYDRYYSAGAEALPLGQGAEFVVPQATTGALVQHTAEAGAVQFQDWVSATLTLDVQTIAGGVTLSQQFADLAPAFANAAIAADLGGKYGQAIESYAVTSTDTNAKGLEAIASVNAVVTTGTDLSVLWKAFLEAKYLLAGSGAYCEPDEIVINPLMWINILAAQGAPVAGTAIDGRPQGIKFPEGNAVNAWAMSNGKTLGEVGTIMGTPVIATPAVSNASNTDTDESRIYFVNRQLGHRIFVSPMRTRIATQVGVATLSPKVVVFGYLAQYAPHPKGVCAITGEAVEAVALGA